MKEISLHLLDIMQNSISAGAHRIKVQIQENSLENSLRITIEDNGKGMDSETVKRVTDPFYTTRETRKIGLGIPLFKASAERCGGGLIIRSRPGKGTSVEAVYVLNHIDRPPMGDVTETLITVIASNPYLNIWFCYVAGQKVFQFDTGQIVKILDGVAMDTPEVLVWLREYIREGIKNIAEV